MQLPRSDQSETNKQPPMHRYNTDSINGTPTHSTHPPNHSSLRSKVTILPHCKPAHSLTILTNRETRHRCNDGCDLNTPPTNRRHPHPLLPRRNPRLARPIHPLHKHPANAPHHTPLPRHRRTHAPRNPNIPTQPPTPHPHHHPQPRQPGTRRHAQPNDRRPPKRNLHPTPRRRRHRPTPPHRNPNQLDDRPPRNRRLWRIHDRNRLPKLRTTHPIPPHPQRNHRQLPQTEPTIAPNRLLPQECLFGWKPLPGRCHVQRRPRTLAETPARRIHLRQCG